MKKNFSSIAVLCLLALAYVLPLEAVLAETITTAQEATTTLQARMETTIDSTTEMSASSTEMTNSATEGSVNSLQTQISAEETATRLSDVEEQKQTEPESAAGPKAIYRLYHPVTGEHLYTPSLKEKDVLYKQAGWGYEGIAWYAPTKGKPVYRLYNRGLKNHLYTTDKNEVEVLTRLHGWTKDFNGAPIFYSGGTVSIYRLYNKKLRGLHHWTTDANEYRVLPRHGWTQEGRALQAEKIGRPIYTQYAADDALASQVKGLGGYQLSGKARRNLVAAIKKIHSQGHQMGFVIMDVHTQKGVEYNADQRFYAASTVKGPYVASLTVKNPASITQSRAIMQQVLSYSSNEGYSFLVNRYGFSSWYDWLREAGVRSDIGKDLYPFYSARELFKLWQRNYRYFTNDRTGQQVGLWFENPNLSPIKAVLGSQYRVRSKAGWIGGWGLFSASDGGIVYAKNGPYIIAIMTNAGGQLDRLNPTVQALHELVLTLNQAHQEMAAAEE